MPFFYKHYILVNSEGVVVEGWSNGPMPNRNVEECICINDHGSYQFRLFSDGEENPPLYNFAYGIPLWRYNADTGEITKRPQSEIDAEIAAIPPAPPSAQEQLRADVDYIAVISGVEL